MSDFITTRFFGFNTTQKMTLRRLVPRFGTQTTRAGIISEVEANQVVTPIGTLYMSNNGTVGKLYIKVANTGAATDWQRFTSTAVD